MSSKEIWSTRHLIVHPFSEKYLESLYAMHGNPEVVHLWAPGIEYHDFASFASKITRRIAHRWDHYVVFEHKGSGCVSGFAYCYNGNRFNNITFMCVYLDLPLMGTVSCIEAAYAYLNNLFVVHDYRKVYAEVFAYNRRSIGLLEKGGFVLEGCLINHQLWRDVYWNQYIYGLDKERYQMMAGMKSKLIKRLLHG
ncbi:MAG: GNAT family N-acetyltransferase [Desulfobulbaceae bacterium]|nr:GNAT family N-acetyltransferase [Desulfobulbaceae bacterium]